MGVLDFLFEGSTPPSATQYGQSVQGMPRWMTDYAQGILSGAASVGAEPYQAYGGPRIQGFAPEQEQAYGMIPGVVSAGQQAIQSVQGRPGALTTAAPYLSGAGRTFPEAVGEYMNPYITNVTDRAAQLTQRALTEKLLPQVEAKFGALGQDPRSSAYRRAVDVGVRDLSEGLQAQNLAALAQGYGQAGELFGADAARMGALAEVSGGLAGQDISQQGVLAQLAQQMGLTGAAALEQVGGARQELGQRGLDLAYQDFLQQRDYPKQTLSWMQGLLQGTPHPTSTSTTDTYPWSGSFQPSGLSQLATALSTGLGAWDAWKNRKKKGGRVSLGPLRYAYA